MTSARESSMTDSISFFFGYLFGPLVVMGVDRLQHRELSARLPFDGSRSTGSRARP